MPFGIALPCGLIIPEQWLWWCHHGQSHYESTFGECRLSARWPSTANPQAKPTDLDCESTSMQHTIQQAYHYSDFSLEKCVSSKSMLIVGQHLHSWCHDALMCHRGSLNVFLGIPAAACFGRGLVYVSRKAGGRVALPACMRAVYLRVLVGCTWHNVCSPVSWRMRGNKLDIVRIWLSLFYTVKPTPPSFLVQLLVLLTLPSTAVLQLHHVAQVTVEYWKWFIILFYVWSVTKVEALSEAAIRPYVCLSVCLSVLCL